MKTLVFDKPTRDVDGLLVELRKLGPVITVASDPAKTYVYLEEAEEAKVEVKNPGAVVKAWKDIPEIRAESMNPAARDGVPIAKADGRDVHTIMIQKTTVTGEVVSERAKLLISTQQPVEISERKVRLRDGLASITVGPSETPGDVYLDVVDSAGQMKPLRLTLRFGLPQSKAAKTLEKAVKDAVLSKEPAKPKSKPEAKAEAKPGQKPEPKSTAPPGLWAKLRRKLGF